MECGVQFWASPFKGDVGVSPTSAHQDGQGTGAPLLYEKLRELSSAWEEAQDDLIHAHKYMKGGCRDRGKIQTFVSGARCQNKRQWTQIGRGEIPSELH